MFYLFTCLTVVLRKLPHAAGSREPLEAKVLQGVADEASAVV